MLDMRTDLIEARRAAGLTQQQVAEAIGKDQGTVSRYENGAPVDRDVAKKLASLLGLEVLTVIFPEEKAESEQGRAA